MHRKVREKRLSLMYGLIFTRLCPRTTLNLYEFVIQVLKKKHMWNTWEETHSSMPPSYLALTPPPPSFDIETMAPPSLSLSLRLSVKQVRIACSINQEVGDGVKSDINKLGIFPLFLFMFRSITVISLGTALDSGSRPDLFLGCVGCKECD